jgi:MSHA biogenesis protein MshE
MDPQAMQQFLHSIPIFKTLSPAMLSELAVWLEEKAFAPGQVAVKQGDKGDELFLVAEGEFQVFVSDTSLDLEKEIHRLGPGTYFGEIALISDRPRLVSVRATKPSRVLILRREAFSDVAGQSPQFAMALCRGIAAYLAEVTERDNVFPFIGLDRAPISADVARLLPTGLGTALRAIVIDRRGDTARVAMVDPYDTGARNFLKQSLRQFRIEFMATSQEDFDRVAPRFYSRESGGDSLQIDPKMFTYVTDKGSVEAISNDKNDVLLRVLKQALELGASDLHFEPVAANGRVRARIDGQLIVLEDGIPGEAFARIARRLKVMTTLDITHKSPLQDGSCQIRIGDKKLEMRLSVIEAKGGDSIAVRFVGSNAQRLDIDSLVMSRPLTLLMKEMFLSPNGLVLVAGPTGAGKTTTLYAGLQEIWSRGSNVKIITIEDPVEHHLDYSTQVQVDKDAGLDFARVLKSVLRQDPDVVLVGEMRDPESAASAIRASITGHVVLSSVHANSANETIVALKNLGVSPFLIASALRGIICQQLVPRVCPVCAGPVDPKDEAVLWLQKHDPIPTEELALLKQGKGCESCRFTGEAGRVAVFETLSVSDHLVGLIEEDAAWKDLHRALTPETFVPMARYARYLLAQGLISPKRLRETFPGRARMEGVAL